MARKRRKKRLTIEDISIIIILLLVIGFGISMAKGNSLEDTFNKITSLARGNKKQEKKEEEEDDLPLEYELSLVMVGDALINDYLYKDAHKLADYNGYDFKPYFKIVKEEIEKYDLAYYNQETILGGEELGLSGYPAFNSPYEVGDAFIDAGFNLVSLATNHTLDRKEKAILNSRSYWNKQDNVYAFGSYSSFSEKEELESKVFTKNNIKYAILNYTYGTNGIPVPSGKEYLVNVWSTGKDYESYKETVIADIEKLRSQVDILLVAMHWGTEYRHEETDIQKKTAEFLAEQGVDIIIGTHPHVIEPVEYVGNTLVFYSLGNFLSSQTSDSCSKYKCNIGLMSSLKIKKTVDGDKVDISITDINNELLYMYHKNYHDYLIIPFSNPLIKAYMDDYEEVYTRYAKIIETEDKRIKTVPLAN